MTSIRTASPTRSSPAPSTAATCPSSSNTTWKTSSPLSKNKTSATPTTPGVPSSSSSPPPSSTAPWSRPSTSAPPSSPSMKATAASASSASRPWSSSPPSMLPSSPMSTTTAIPTCCSAATNSASSPSSAASTPASATSCSATEKDTSPGPIPPVPASTSPVRSGTSSPSREKIMYIYSSLKMTNTPCCMKSVNSNLFLVPLLFTLSCHPGKKEGPPLFDLLTNTGVNFSNDVTNKPDFNIFTYRNFYNGGGVAIGDINNDGLPDIFFTSNMGGNKLYLNKGNMQFEDISAKAGFAQDKKQWSTGVTMADVNGDGWLDIYVCNAGHMENGALRKNQLFINNHDGTFTDSAEAYGLADSGYSTQATFFDYDGDGWLDCFLINNSPIPVNTLDYANKRDLPAGSWSISDSLKGGGDHLFHNNHGHFHEVTRQAGIHGSLISLGLGVSVGDFNDDGRPDIYVSNDFFERDYLYINQGDGTFKDELEDCMGHISLASMGADIADINNDGYPDLFTTDMVPYDDERLKTTFSFENIDVYRLKQRSGFYHQFFQNCLQLNNRHGKFLEIGNYAGVSATDWSWGTLMFDMDNDGYNDIYVSNGISRDLTNQDFLEFTAATMERKMLETGNKDKLFGILDKMPSSPLFNKVFRNLGNLHFQDIGADWGFTHPSFSNGAAYGDLDNDGDLDLVINNENGPAFIYRNNARQLNHNHYIGALLKGNSPNTFAIGSKIRLYRDSSVFYREVVPSRGFQSSVDYKQIIGLGQIPTVDSLVITWPDGQSTRFLHPALDAVYTLHQPDGPALLIMANSPQLTHPLKTHTPAPGAPLVTAAPPDARATNGPANTHPLLTPIPAAFDKHQEHDNPDF